MGNYNASETVNKVIRINNRILGTMAGGAADCQYWEKYLGQILVKQYELNYQENLSIESIS